MRQAYAGSNYRVRHVQSAVHDAHLPFTGMQLKVVGREPSEDVPQCRDTYPSKNGKQYEVIPIHASAWGATTPDFPLEVIDKFQSTRPRGARRLAFWPWHGLPRFNPRARVGRDAPVVTSHQRHRKFQSTRPRGARRSRLMWERETCSFNPRARVGRDAPVVTSHQRHRKFQSTRPRGARPAVGAEPS